MCYASTDDGRSDPDRGGFLNHATPGAIEHGNIGDLAPGDPPRCAAWVQRRAEVGRERTGSVHPLVGRH